MKKKLMAMLLALALVMSLMPVAFAESAEGYPKEEASTLAGCVSGCKKVTDKTTDAGATETVTYTHVAGCVEKCTEDDKCPNDVGGNHKPGCYKLCTKNDRCPNPLDGKHQDGCPKGPVDCDSSADPVVVGNAGCTVSDNHVAGCPMKCTVAGCVKDKDHDGAHSQAACTGNANCPNKEFKDAANHKESCVGKCTGLINCENAAGHLPNCISQCTGDVNCPNTGDNHKSTGDGESKVWNCVSKCTMSAACKAADNKHKDNCVTLCTFGETVTVTIVVTPAYTDDEGNEHEAETRDVTYTHGETCPNTSGDPTVHKAGCVKANVSDSIVLDPNGNPVESTDPSEEPTESQPTEITKAEDFSDVNADDWFAPELTAVVEKGWLKGNEDGSFDPDGEVSGQQAVVFVSRMLGKDLVTTGANWADEATAWAAEDGLTEGIEITSEGIARKDLILLLWRAAGKQTSDHEISFSDVDELEGDYLTALKWAVENEIIKGNDDGTATPHAATSRGEIAAILARYDKAVNK